MKIKGCIVLTVVLLIGIPLLVSTAFGDGGGGGGGGGMGIIGNLTIKSNTGLVYVGNPTSVTFTVENMDSGEPINGAQVQLTGAATGSGTTSANGNATFTINANNPGTITATASASGYNDASTTVTVKAQPQLNLSANANILYIGVPQNVTFTVNHVCGTAPGDQCSGSGTQLVPNQDVAITLSGAASGTGSTAFDAMTGTASATILINATPPPGNVTVTAHEDGYQDGIITIPTDYLPVALFTADKGSYFAGDTVNLTITNIGPVAINPDKWWVKNVSIATPVYISPSLGNDTLLPGQSANFTWNQTDNRNNLVPPGNYKAGVSFSYHDRPYSNYTGTFSILPCMKISEPPQNVNSTVGQDVVFHTGNLSSTGKTWNIRWYINGTDVFNETGVTGMSNYTNNSAAVGVWNVTAMAQSGCNTITWSFVWTVTQPPNCFNIMNSAKPFTSYVNQAAGFRSGNLSSTNKLYNFTWYINGTEVYNETNAVQSAYVNRTPALGVWNVTVFAESGCSKVSWAWTWTVSPAPPNPPGDSGGGSGGGGSGGGGITTAEPYTNILKFARQDNDLVKGASVTYSFTDPVFSIYQVLVTGRENEGTVGLRLEHLKNASALVNRNPAGIVYANENLWLGSKRADSIVVRFRVDNSWMSDNGLGKENMYLLRFNDGWTKLNTKIINSDGNYTYFEAKTPGLSEFAVSGLKDTAQVPAAPPDEITASGPEDASGADSTAAPGGKKLPGFEMVMAGTVLVLVAYFIKRRF